MTGSRRSAAARRTESPVEPARSALMARIRDRDTAPETLLRRLLWAKGLRYRRSLRVEGVRPDIVFPGKRVAVFVDGCFWHGCPKHYVRPRSRTGFWQKKLRSNVERDIRQTRALMDAGWTVVRLWEHQVFEDPEGAASRVEIALTGWCPRGNLAWRVCEARPLRGANDIEEWRLVSLTRPGRIRTRRRKRTTAKWSRKAR